MATTDLTSAVFSIAFDLKLHCFAVYGKYMIYVKSLFIGPNQHPKSFFEVYILNINECSLMFNFSCSLCIGINMFSAYEMGRGRHFEFFGSILFSHPSSRWETDAMRAIL